MKRTLIQIGEVFASRTPAQAATVLGSCVSVCLYDPDRGVGGLNHFMLPAGGADIPLPARYGVQAMELLINRIMSLGGARRALEAKLFGGARLWRDGALLVGPKNVQFAREFLQREAIPLVAERTGGREAVAVHFFTATGRVLLKPVRPAAGRRRLQDEKEFQRALARAAREDRVSVTLFGREREEDQSVDCG